jgi:drug/metabolite transporter (DMT)-like permease
MLLVTRVSSVPLWTLWPDILLCGRMFSVSLRAVPWAKSSSVSLLPSQTHYSRLTINSVYTLSTFSSVLLVTVTVTRKMFTMILSVLAFGHRLTQMQWLGVALVFGGIGVEAGIARQEKMAKETAKKAQQSGKKEL